jgi:hypothetical protein
MQSEIKGMAKRVLPEISLHSNLVLLKCELVAKGQESFFCPEGQERNETFFLVLLTNGMLRSFCKRLVCNHFDHFLRFWALAL